MNSLILKLIQPITLKGPIPIKIDEAELSEIKAEGIKHNLFILLYSQLKKYHKDIFQEKYVNPVRCLLSNGVNNFFEDSKALYLKSVTLSMRQEAVENEIFSLLKDKDVPSVVIKGNEIAKEIYDDPNCRVSVDIDILTRRADAIQVDSVLLEAGYGSDIKIPFRYCLSHIHHATYYHPNNNMMIEIHWNFGVPYFFNLTSEEIWNEISFTDSSNGKLSPDMLIIMLLIHHHSHSFRQLKILVDILWALYKYENEIDWNKFTNKLRKIGLVKTTQITLNQIVSLWGENVEAMPPVQLLKQEFQKMGFRTPKTLTSYFKFELERDYSSHLYKDKFVARFALDRWSIILLSFIKTLFPVPEAIKELYGVKRTWTLPYHYLRFIGWRVRDWTGHAR